MTILVVEDDPTVRETIQYALRASGLAMPTTTGSGSEALSLVEQVRPAAVVLDVGLPGLDGLEVCRQLRGRGDRVPILMLTARDAVGDRVSGLDAGADDYLVKPFALEELLARLRALLRRTDDTATRRVLRFSDLCLDTWTREVRRGDRPIEVTRTEYHLLELFLMNPLRVLTRSLIVEKVWGYDFGPASNSLEVFVGYLRRKLEEGDASRLIHTVWGVGYVLRE